MLGEVRFDQHWFDQHKCQWCGRKCRPNYDRVCTVCRHPWFYHTLLADGHCSGKVELPTARHLPLVDCDCQRRGDLKSNPTAFSKKLLGYGLNDRGFFCKKECAVRWAQYVISNQRKEGK